MKKRVFIKLDAEVWESTKAQAASEHRLPHEWVEEAIREKLEKVSKEH